MTIKRNGFTLVELLAIIAILIAILFIATKTVQGVMYKTKLNSFSANAQMLLQAVNLKKADEPGYNPLLLTTDNLETDLGLLDENYDLLTVTTSNGEYYIYFRF